MGVCDASAKEEPGAFSSTPTHFLLTPVSWVDAIFQVALFQFLPSRYLLFQDERMALADVPSDPWIMEHCGRPSSSGSAATTRVAKQEAGATRAMVA